MLETLKARSSRIHLGNDAGFVRKFDNIQQRAPKKCFLMCVGFTNLLSQTYSDTFSFIRLSAQTSSNGCLGLRLLLEHLNAGNFMPTEQMESSPMPQSINEKIAIRFLEEGGMKILLTLLLAGGGNVFINPLEVKDEDVKLKELCLDVLNKLCIINTTVADYLSDTEEAVIYCFHLLKNQQLYSKSCKLIEHLLLAKKSTLNLCVIPNLHKMLEKLEGGRLASFCKILAITVSDLDIFEHKSSLYKQNIQKRSEDFVPIRDINQELVLSVNGLMGKLVDHATRLPYNPRFPSTPSEIDHWMRAIDDHISDEMAMGEMLMMESYPGGGVADQTSNLVDDLTDRVEVGVKNYIMFKSCKIRVCDSKENYFMLLILSPLSYNMIFCWVLTITDNDGVACPNFGHPVLSSDILS